MTPTEMIAGVTRNLARMPPTEIVQAVRDGMCSVRRAAPLLRCTTDEVQLAAWGRLML